MRAYAIGDIHGQTALLRDAHVRVEEDRRRTGDTTSPVIHLGDLVDRGPDAKGTISYLIGGIAAGLPWIVLKGNHDSMFALFMADPDAHDPGLRHDYSWLHPRIGGRTTLASYGVDTRALVPDEDLCAAARGKVPPGHLAFLDALPLTYLTAGALFVHAGVRPGVPFAEQSEVDLMWIRRGFHEDMRDHGALVVHGHTPVDVPRHYGNRVNLDTGAAYGGPLTAAVIEDGAVSILTSDGRVPLPPPEPGATVRR